jgi:hypothetical protein
VGVLAANPVYCGEAIGTMSDSDQEKLNRQFERLELRLPESMRGFTRWLRKPSSRWVRIPFALLFIAGGLMGFLPVLGLWMLPIGFLLLAQDLPFLRRPTRRALVGVERWWRARKRHGRGGGEPRSTPGAGGGGGAA